MDETTPITAEQGPLRHWLGDVHWLRVTVVCSAVALVPWSHAYRWPVLLLLGVVLPVRSARREHQSCALRERYALETADSARRRQERPCPACSGEGSFPDPDYLSSRDHVFDSYPCDLCHGTGEAALPTDTASP